jgi:hypothetical protein
MLKARLHLLFEQIIYAEFLFSIFKARHRNTQAQNCHKHLLNMTL